MAMRAIVLSHFETPRVAARARLRMMAAGIYVRYSETRTVARM